MDDETRKRIESLAGEIGSLWSALESVNRERETTQATASFGVTAILETLSRLMGRVISPQDVLDIVAKARGQQDQPTPTQGAPEEGPTTELLPVAADAQTTLDEILSGQDPNVVINLDSWRSKKPPKPGK